MKLGLMLGYSGKHIQLPLERVRRAEALGFDSVWTAESYGSDAVTPATWLLAQTERIRVGTCIMQIPARTPAMTAMTAMTLDQLAGGRFILGLGASGPQVVEGWHGVAYDRPVTRTREYVQILRRIMAREGPVEFDGKLYQLPLRGDRTTGLGKPLKSILAASPDIPIYTASITPAGLACAAEVADGVFPVWMSPERFEVLAAGLDDGFARAGAGKSLAHFDVAPNVPMIVGDDIDACRQPIKQFLALYIGGMGSAKKNFYHDYAMAMGYGEPAEAIQRLYLGGHKEEAAAAVPDALVDEIALIGPERRIRERAEAWLEASALGRVGTLLLAAQQDEALELAADIFVKR